VINRLIIFTLIKKFLGSNSLIILLTTSDTIMAGAPFWAPSHLFPNPPMSGRIYFVSRHRNRINTGYTTEFVVNL